MQGDEIALGPGKVDLLEAIESEGSISGAARALGMSYRRAWLLIDTMNRCFAEPLVAASPGGRGGGGAQVTDTGRTVIRLFRHMQAQAKAATAEDAATLAQLLGSDSAE